MHSPHLTVALATALLLLSVPAALAGPAVPLLCAADLGVLPLPCATWSVRHHDGNDRAVELLASPGGERVHVVVDTSPLGGGFVEGHVLTLDGRTGETLWRVEQGDDYYAGGAALTRDGATLLVGYGGHQVVAYDAATGATRWATPWFPAHVDALALSSAEDVVAVAGRRIDEVSLSLFRVADGRLVWNRALLGGDLARVEGLSFTPSGDGILVLHDDGRLDRVGTGDAALAWSRPMGPGFAPADLAVAGSVAVAAGSERASGRVVGFDVATGEALWDTEVLGFPADLAASPDGASVAVAGAAAASVAWAALLDSRTGAVAWQAADALDPYVSSAQHAVFSPGGGALALSGHATVGPTSYQATLTLLDAATGVPFATTRAGPVDGHDFGRRAQFSADGGTVFALAEGYRPGTLLGQGDGRAYDALVAAYPTALIAAPPSPP